MASLSSTNSVSGSNSLGNTALRGFGGMVSGIDRDSIIEAMTIHTSNRVTAQQQAITKLEWKQEAYRNVTDQILGLSDDYLSYSSGKSLMDASIFEKNVITVQGRDDVRNFVKATGSSELAANVSLTSVRQLATASTRESAQIQSAIQTTLTSLDAQWVSSKLKGGSLIFGTPSDQDGNVSRMAAFTFADSYTKDGKAEPIDYTNGENLSDEEFYKKLAGQLNESLKEQGEKQMVTVGGEKKGIDAIFQFVGNANGIKLEKTADADSGKIVLHKDSTALAALGYNGEAADSGKTGIALDSQNVDFKNTALNSPTALQYMTGKKLTFEYDGNKKEIELVTEQDTVNSLQDMAEYLQKRLNKAYGENVVQVTADATNGLSFSVSGNSSSLSITSDNMELLSNLGIAYGESTGVNLNSKLNQAALKGKLNANVTAYETDGSLNLKINGTQITGLTKDSSVKEILSKINSSDAGVKATYSEATGKFMLLSAETGANRQISLDSQLAQDLFGQKGDSGAYEANLGFTKGKNAIVAVDYGSGADDVIERASNTFNLEGMSVTVSSVFGGKYTDPANKNSWVSDTSQRITFSAAADADGATERVKSFIEEFNKMAKEVNTQVVTYPDSKYGVLTDAQKAEMSEDEIKKWEAKAKEGILYGDSTMRDLSTSIQSVLSNLMMGGISYNDLEKIGITYSDDPMDGGTLVFNEASFKKAMESEPELVSKVITGENGVKGLAGVVEDALTPYATRYASKNASANSKGHYGLLIEIAGTDKKPTTLYSNQIYAQLKTMNETLEALKAQLKTQQDRAISQFTYMEGMISQFNSQSSYLSQING